LGIKSIPAVVAFQRGRPVDGFVGALPESQIKGFIERLVGPIEDSAADALEAAQELIDAGDVSAAHELLSELVNEEPVNPKAVALLARLYIAAGQLDSARALLDRLPESARKDPEVAAAAAAIENAAAAQDLGEVEDLKARINFDPNDLQAYFDLALALNARDRRDEAAEALLEIIRRDRSWNEDGARKQLVQFFEAWGPMDKAAVAARRRLSTLLFS
jgi:putative thioredoxin